MLGTKPKPAAAVDLSASLKKSPAFPSKRQKSHYNIVERVLRKGDLPLAKKKKTIGNRYAIYCRCSSDDYKHQDFTTIDCQEELNTVYVRDRGVVFDVYKDEGRTGTNLNRPEYCRMLKDAEAGRFDRICVTYMSRLARGRKFYVAEDKFTDELGIPIELVQENFTNDFAGEMSKGATVFADGIQPLIASHQTKTKMHEMARKGHFCGGNVAFGYRSVYIKDYDPTVEEREPPKRLEINDDEAEIVKAAFQECLRRKTVASVRDYLNSVSVREWNSTTARSMLTNIIYTGIYEWGSTRNENHHAAIIDQDAFDQVHEILEASKAKRTRSARNDNYTYYLRGLIRCPHCGCNYTNSFAKGGEVYYYECHCKKKNPKTNHCPVVRINSNALHDAVLGEIKRAAEHRTVMHSLIAKSGGWQNADESVKQLRGQLGRKKGQVDLQISNLLKYLGDGRGYDTILDRLNTLEGERKQLLSEMGQLDTEILRSTVKRPTAEAIQEVWSEMVDLWDYVSEEEKTQLMSLIVRDVQVQQKNSVSLHLNPIADFSEFKVRNNRGNGSGERI